VPSRCQVLGLEGKSKRRRHGYWVPVGGTGREKESKKNLGPPSTAIYNMEGRDLTRDAN